MRGGDPVVSFAVETPTAPCAHDPISAFRWLGLLPPLATLAKLAEMPGLRDGSDPAVKAALAEGSSVPAKAKNETSPMSALQSASPPFVSAKLSHDDDRAIAKITEHDPEVSRELARAYLHFNRKWAFLWKPL